MSRHTTPRVLFVCVQNAGRSQIAASLFNRQAAGRALADSAGTRPALHVHTEVVNVMREVGIELANARPKALSPELAATADLVVTMGCGDECPVVRAPVVDWALPDPKGMSAAQVRELRDEIDRRVGKLLAELGRAELKSS